MQRILLTKLSLYNTMEIVILNRSVCRWTPFCFERKIVLFYRMPNELIILLKCQTQFWLRWITARTA